ncbi:amino acid transporter [Methyloceanibacter superfactus]|uniref:Amino acid transporter n=1 Tax=Methyloceanibacter superfactus TaxID=1774969 RepID=A0A1E3VJQ0_9HYPH|nr:APC family permease [Methyloceanibacter superfactus]ODR93733.1 amino acid transporter [Methyloceanibacter superfactus]
MANEIKTDVSQGVAGEPALHRSIGPTQMALYGLGSMLGAGIYGLMGKAAGQVGNAVWLAFIIALIAALLTALSYASLGSRYPRAAGAAYVTQRAYGFPLLSFMVGLALVCSGLTSIATQSRVFAANLADLFGIEGVPIAWLALGFLLVTTGIVFRGIRESMWVNVVCTLVEAGGLILVIAVGISYWGSVDYLETPAGPVDGETWLIVVQGAVLAFFAFIGFEDMYNVAEEVRDPQRTIPLGLILAMAAAALLYMGVAITAVSVVPWQELAVAPGPITEVVARAAPMIPPVLFTGITLFAVGNTGLVNYITSSRLLYGMGRQGLLPAFFGKVHDDRRTPHIAILVLFLILAPLALTGTIAELASATVLLLLAVFTVVNGSLFVLKRRQGEKKGRFEVPLFVPALGAVVCVSLIVVRVSTGDWRAPAIAGALLLGCFVIYMVMRARAGGPLHPTVGENEDAD